VSGAERERSVSGAENGAERVKNSGAVSGLVKVPERERSVERHELPAQIALQPP